jgi:hypothetical protein
MASEEALLVFEAERGRRRGAEQPFFVAVPPDRDPQPVRDFRTFAAELERLAEWLAHCRIKTVAMNQLVYIGFRSEILEQRGLEVVLLNESSLLSWSLLNLRGFRPAGRTQKVRRRKA